MADDKKRELYEISQRGLVSSLIESPERIPNALDIASPDDIEEPSLSVIYAHIGALSKLDTIEKVSVIEIARSLESEGMLEKVGGTLELFNLEREGKIARAKATPEAYARLTKEFSAKTKIAQTLKDNIDNFADDSGIPAAEAVTIVQSLLNEQILHLSDDSTLVDFSTQGETYMERLKERKQRSEENINGHEGLQGIPSLLPTLNKYTTGWRPGQLITVAAGTGVGKSVFAINCALAGMESNMSVLFFSLEMSEEELSDRLVSGATSIPAYKLQQGRIDTEEEKLVNEYFERIEQLKIVIETDPKQTVDSIRARALKQAQSERGLDFIIVDYLQLIGTSRNVSNRQEAVAELSREMKLLAKQLNVPVMVLAQMRRKTEDAEAGTLPTLDGIRESGAIAQDSDIVILLHREISHDGIMPNTLVILAKNRNGQKDIIVRCHSNLECHMFREVVKVQDLSGGETELDTGDVDAGEQDLDILSESDDFGTFGFDSRQNSSRASSSDGGSEGGFYGTESLGGQQNNRDDDFEFFDGDDDVEIDLGDFD